MHADRLVIHPLLLTRPMYRAVRTTQARRFPSGIPGVLLRGGHRLPEGPGIPERVLGDLPATFSLEAAVTYLGTYMSFQLKVLPRFIFGNDRDEKQRSAWQWI
jgi:hypothetical protein